MLAWLRVKVRAWRARERVRQLTRHGCRDEIVLLEATRQALAIDELRALVKAEGYRPATAGRIPRGG